MDIKILEEKPVTMMEIKKELETIKKKTSELNFRANKVKEYVDMFVSLDEKSTKELMKKLIDLNIPRLKERHIVKIVDILPNDVESVKILLTGENITVKQEDLERITNIAKEYIK